MQVTFLIGNGFDLNLGLRTRYTQFYRHYLKDPAFATEDPEILQFKNLFCQDIRYSHWADFERALGRHTVQPPLDKPDSLRSCLKDFKRCFSQYLRREEERIDFASCGYEMAEKFSESLHSHLTHLEPRFFGIIQVALPLHERTEFHILDFNYTTVIDRIAGFLTPDMFGTDSLESVIHVHGTHSSGMILGVDSLDQVANPALFTDPRQQRILLKPLLNQQSGQGNDQTAWDCIKSSEEVCIFGMSLGETDATWWLRLGMWLEVSSRHQLLIFSRNSDLDPLYPEDILDYQDKIRDRFLSYTDISSGRRKFFRDRIHVVTSSDIFDLAPVLKDFSV
jgi:hypothetical protein